MSPVRLHTAAAGSVVLVGLSMGLLSGCPDPQATFDAFGARYDKINGTGASTTAGGGGACVAPAAGMLDGDWLFTLSAKIKPKQAVVLLMNVVTADAGGGALTISFKETPLSYMDQMTPAGPQVDLGSYPIAADGSFMNSFPSITVPGAANPITKGSDISADVTLTGETCASDLDFVCGAVSGKVTAPLMLDLGGSPTSTFTIQRVVGGVIPAPVINCAKDPASYD